MAYVYVANLDDSSFDDGSTSTAWEPQNYCYGGTLTLTAGNAVELGVYCGNSHLTEDSGMKVGIYDSSDNLVADATLTVPANTSLAWRTASAINAGVSAGTYKLIASAESVDVNYGRTAAEGSEGRYTETGYASAMADPETFVSDSYRYGLRVDVVSGTSLNGTEDSKTITAQNASVTYSADTSITGVEDSKTISAQSASVSIGSNTTITGVEDSKSISTEALSFSYTLHSNADSKSITAQGASVSVASGISATEDSKTINAQAASIIASSSITATQADLSITAQAAVIDTAANITAISDSLSLFARKAGVSYAGQELGIEGWGLLQELEQNMIQPLVRTI